MRRLCITGAVLAAPILASAEPGRLAVAEHPAASIVDDASDLANLLAGDMTAEPAARPVAHGPAITVRPAVVTIGNDSVGFRGDDTFRANTADAGLPLAFQRLQTTTLQHQESTARTTLSTEPTGSAMQAAGQPVKLDGRELRAMSRCYRRVPGLQPDDTDSVDLMFAVDRTGNVIEPVVISDDDDLTGCIGKAMKTWRFAKLKPKRGARIWLTVKLAAR